MSRAEVLRQIAFESTQPLQELCSDGVATQERINDPGDIFIWFEDTSERLEEGERGIAGLPESLLPVGRDIKVLERRYCPGHSHLLAAVRIRCRARAGEHIAAIYTAALTVGTIAWIGAGSQYATAWDDLYGDPA